MKADAWGVLLRQALAMGIAPEVFWRLSLREWRMLTEPAGEATCLSPSSLRELMERWPDAG